MQDGSREIQRPLLPPGSDIAAVLAEMVAEFVALERRYGKTRALEQTIMQELLTGKIRLV